MYKRGCILRKLPNRGLQVPKIGVYICHCGLNIAGVIHVKDVTEHAITLPDVVLARHYSYVCSGPGQRMIQEDIRQNKLDRIVIASCSPQMHEETFRATMTEAGLNPYLLEVVNLREQCSWCHSDAPEKATEKAKELVRMGVARVKLLEPLTKPKLKAEKSVLVVGGGIAGIQAALDLADQGLTVYLVEKSPSVGGRMAQLDKTFPTLDCSACILTPKMVEIARHPNIELITYGEVEDVRGFVGNYEVTVLKKPRYIDEEKCTGCGECERVCPVELLNEFEMDLGTRKAIYRPFPQAVPNVFTIDKRGIPPCRAACPAGVNVQGYIALIAEKKFEEALELIRREIPIPAVCGRVCFHPCESECKRGEVDQPLAINALKRFVTDYVLKQKREMLKPLRKTHEEKIAVIGSGPAGLAAAYELLKEGYPVTIFESLPNPGGMLRIGIPNYRLPKNILDREIDYLKALGVEIQTNITLGKNLALNDIREMGYKAVFLAIGVQKSRVLGIEGERLVGVIQALKLLKEANLGKDVKLGNRVAVIGGGDVAIDAARVALRLGATEVHVLYRRSRREMPAFRPDVEQAEREGIKIHFLTAPKRILGKDKKVTALECIKIKLAEPDETGRRKPMPIKDTEHLFEADMVILAIGQTLEPTVLPAEIKLTRRGMIKTDPVTFQTSSLGVFAGGDAVLGSSTVIEAIATGKKAAVSIDLFLRGEDLKYGREEKTLPIVKDVRTEGIKKKPRQIMPAFSVEQRVKSFEEIELGFTEKMAIEEARRCLSCAACCECLECEKVCELEGTIIHEQAPERIKIKVGAIIIAVGSEVFDATDLSELGYNRFEDVISNLQFERLCNASGPTEGKIVCPSTRKPPRSIAFIQCVGCRDARFHEYCCRVGCMISLKQAILSKEKLGNKVDVYICFHDMRAFGKGYEEFYRRARDMGIQFISGFPSEVRRQSGNSLMFDVYDSTTDKLLEFHTDLVVLASGLVPSQGFDRLQEIFNVSLGQDGFFLEAHPKLRPLECITKGIFIAGTCQGPKDIPDTVAQASGAAMKATDLLAKGEIEIEPIIATIVENLCSGCRICESICPYDAIEMKTESVNGVEKFRAEVIDVMCQGCGSCSSACPTNAIKMQHYADEQVLAQVHTALTTKQEIG
ncbi:FAD-binding protein [Candidatus Bathyarchaeota archaeon]|nr:MAG: FAD-binding protein [Candidatus Bathyarchaeota archaeon]